MDVYTEHLLSGIAIAQRTSVAEISSKSIATKRKRASHGTGDIPWTASRCNRLLRTITSRVNTLQRLAASNGLEKIATERLDGAVTSSRATTGSSGTVNNPEITTSPSKDPAWYPKSTKSHIVKTYGGKTKPKPSKSDPRPQDKLPACGTLGISTPFVKRMLRPDLLTASSKKKATLSSSVSACGVKLSEKRKVCRQLPIRPSSAAAEAFVNLETALYSFLRATRPEDPRHIIGASSLMSSCLRRVPAYVVLEDEYNGKTGDALFDEAETTTDSIYDELEALGTARGAGWTGLREVVRADGLFRIKEAILARLLPMRVVVVLANSCGSVGAHVEGQQLICAALEARVSGRRVAIAELLDIAEKYGCGGSVLRTLGGLLQSGIVTALEITAQTHIWRVFLHSMVHDRDRPEAVEFLRVYMLAAWQHSSTGSSGSDKNGIRHALRGAAVLLTAITMGRGDDSETSTVSLANELRRIATQAALIEIGNIPLLDQTEAKTCNSRGTLSPFLLSKLMLEIGDGDLQPARQCLDAQELAELLKYKDDSEHTEMFNLSPFVSDVALCIARWNQEAGDTFLSTTIRKLLRTSKLFTSPSATAMFEDLALGSAKAYAEIRGDKSSIVLAEEVEEMVLHGAQLCTPKTPGTVGARKDRFRWEEGLCEWIARTPFGIPVADGTEGAYSRPGSNTSINRGTVAQRRQVPGFTTASMPRQTIATKAVQQQQRPAERAAVKSKSVAHGEQQAHRRKRQCVVPQAKQAKAVIAFVKHSDAQESDTEELDELAFSAKKAQRPMSYLIAPQHVKWATKPQTRRHESNSMKRISSGISGWSTLDDSGDELGIDSSDELGM